MGNVTGIYFNYTYILRLVLVITIYFARTSIYPEVHAARILVKQKSCLQVPNLLNMFSTNYYIKYNSKYRSVCYILYFLLNFKLKTEVIFG